MRSRISLALGTVVCFALPAVVYATQIPFFGPIIPQGENMGTCAAGWGGLVTVINNLISFAVTLEVMFIIPVFIAYVGFLYVVNPVNPSARTHANELLRNVVIGLVVGLSAWLIVNALMAVLYNPNANGFGKQWFQLLINNGQGFCLQDAQLSFQPGVSSGSGALVNAPLLGASQNPKTGCTTQDLTQYFGASAAAMSCATRYENATCNPLAPSGTDFTNDGHTVSTGLFQVNITSSNLNFPSCLAAVGSSQPLNCKQVWTAEYTGPQDRSKVSVRPGMQDQWIKCMNAANNVACNIDAAKQAYNDRVNNSKNPLSAWGTNAQKYCSAQLPQNRTLLSLLASIFAYEK